MGVPARACTVTTTACVHTCAHGTHMCTVPQPQHVYMHVYMVHTGAQTVSHNHSMCACMCAHGTHMCRHCHTPPQHVCIHVHMAHTCAGTVACNRSVCVHACVAHTCTCTAAHSYITCACMCVAHMCAHTTSHTAAAHAHMCVACTCTFACAHTHTAIAHVHALTQHIYSHVHDDRALHTHTCRITTVCVPAFTQHTYSHVHNHNMSTHTHSHTGKLIHRGVTPGLSLSTLSAHLKTVSAQPFVRVASLWSSSCRPGPPLCWNPPDSQPLVGPKGV